MNWLFLSVLLAAIVGGGILYTANRMEAGTDQRNWILTYDKGNYRGPQPQAPLSEATLSTLRTRMVYQTDSTANSAGYAGAGIGNEGRNVRPPETATTSKVPEQ